MSQWKLSTSTVSNAYYNWFLHRNVLVKIHRAGQYVILSNEKGKADTEVPHIEVLLDGTKMKGRFFYTDALIRVYSPKRWRPSLTMVVWKSGPQPPSESPDILLNLAKIQLDEAEKVLRNLGQMFQDAKNRVKQAYAYPTVFKTRAEYVAACKALNAEVFSDELCRSYSIEFGEFLFPDYSADHCLSLKLARRRLRGIVESGEKSLLPPPEKKAQQWEGCKICGREPRYQPLLVCDQCWPKAK
ncbi:MAG: hypothetical protein ACRCWB_08770 [Enterovibrio sp.]